MKEDPKHTVVLVGRPNVGKSSVFNGLLGRSRTIVTEIPGTTVDIVREECRYENGSFDLCDSPGIIDEKNAHELEKLLAVGGVVLFVVDGSTGPVPTDRWFAREIKKARKPVLLVVNKMDKAGGDAFVFSELGFDQMVEVSAVHRRNLDPVRSWCTDLAGRSVGEAESPITVALLGRPNTGKSTLMNRLCKTKVSTVSPIPHTTRDVVSYEIEAPAGKVRLLDTAGVRRPRSAKEKLEVMSIDKSLRAMRRSDVTLLMIASHEAITDQDLRLLELVQKEGKPALVLLNFWDRLSRKEKNSFFENSDLGHHLKSFHTFPISAHTGFQIERILPSVRRLFKKSDYRIRTSDLNSIVERMVRRNPPPVMGNRNFNILYASQVKAKPPTFIFFMNRSGALPGSYRRYLENNLRSALGLKSQPMRLFFRGEK